MPIVLPNEVDTQSRVPRSSIAFDRSSGIRRLPNNAKRLLIVAQKLAAGAQPASVPLDVFRETDGELAFGAGSVMDVAIKAALKAYPFVLLTCVATVDAQGAAAAAQTVTFTGPATADCQYAFRLGGRTVLVAISSGDSATVIGASFAAAIAALLDLSVTAAAAAGVVTLTARNKGTVGNGLALWGQLSRLDAGVTATLGGANLAAGAGVADVAAALAACAGQRYHDIVIAADDAAMGAELLTSTTQQGDAEHGKGEVGIQAVVGSLSTATTLATALNGVRAMVWAIRGTETWYPAVAAAVGAVMTSESDPARPYNTLEVAGVMAPPIASRWIESELKALLAGGVSPLVVGSDGKVHMLRAVSTNVLDGQGNPNYTLFDITKIQSFDYTRDAIGAMFADHYSRSKWADDDPDGLLPPDVATPKKVETDVLNVLRTLEQLGVCQGVEGLAGQLVVAKVGTQCQMSIPANFVDGLHEVLGKVVLIETPFSA